MGHPGLKEGAKNDRRLGRLWQQRQELARELREYEGKPWAWDEQRVDAKSARLEALDDRILAAEARTLDEGFLQIRTTLASYEFGGRDFESAMADITRIVDRLEALAGRATA